jgi:hypothetical protein
MLRPRKPTFALDASSIPRHWFGGNVLATHLGNGVNLLFPAGERFFVRAVNYYVQEIRDPELRAEIRGFFGQEGRHSQAHEQDFERLRAQGYEIDRFLKVYQAFSYDFLERLTGPELRLAATAAAEHYTAIMAEGALAEGVLEHAHPEMQKLLKWHAAEEIEHKHVAFDVLHAVNPSYGLRIAGLALATANLLAWWLAGATVLIAQERLSPRELVRQLRGMRAGQARDRSILRHVFLRGIREYLRRDFHPRDNDNYDLARDYLQTAGLEPLPAPAHAA